MNGLGESRCRTALTGNSLNQRHGRGRVEFWDGSVLCSAHYYVPVSGRMEYPNGSVYQGEWDNHGRRQGRAVYFAGSSTSVRNSSSSGRDVVLRMVLQRIRIEVMITTRSSSCIATRANLALTFMDTERWCATTLAACYQGYWVGGWGKPTGFGRYRELMELYVTKDCGTRDDQKAWTGCDELIQ
jgi:hypothetical protein